MGYWDATDGYMKSHGRGPTCPSCGEEMFPQDDHGRFTCFCNLGASIDVRTGSSFGPSTIPQVDTDGMSDEEKAQIPPVNRLNDSPTKAEAGFFKALMNGGEGPEYVEAFRKLKKERGEEDED